jgi:hypothetical protein
MGGMLCGIGNPGLVVIMLSGCFAAAARQWVWEGSVMILEGSPPGCLAVFYRRAGA